VSPDSVPAIHVADLRKTFFVPVGTRWFWRVGTRRYSGAPA
jgi:hypothetical protein